MTHLEDQRSAWENWYFRGIRGVNTQFYFSLYTNMFLKIILYFLHYKQLSFSRINFIVFEISKKLFQFSILNSTLKSGAHDPSCNKNLCRMPDCTESPFTLVSLSILALVLALIHLFQHFSRTLVEDSLRVRIRAIEILNWVFYSMWFSFLSLQKFEANF